MSETSLFNPDSESGGIAGNDGDPGSATIVEVTLEPNNPKRLAAVCGPLDQNLKHLEERLSVRIRNRGNRFQIGGKPPVAQAASAIVSALYKETAQREAIEPDLVHLFLQEAGVDALLRNDTETVVDDVIRTSRKSIMPRGGHQRDYTSMVRNNDISFGIGPAGTGKTYLAVACAVEALESRRVSRIILVRPAVEAGEKLGFLPGDLAQKIDPYLRPLYDALFEMMGTERVEKLIEKNVIEVAPLAYMRGRTLNNAFIILDESQNTSIEQMKMFLTRIGFGSTAVITGDVTQIDLPRGQISGLVHVRRVLSNVPGITFTVFNSKDVVRHPLVQKIVDAYAAYKEPPPAGRHADDS